VEVNVIGPEATGSRELIKKTVVLFVLLLTSVQSGAAEWLTKFSDTEHNALAGMPELADVAYLGKGSWLEGHRGVKDRSGGQISIGVIAVSAQEVTFLQWVEVAQNYTIVAKASVSGLQAVVFGRMGNYSLIELVRKNGGADSFAINSWIGGTSPGKNQVVATYLQSLVEKTKPD
jgi:hypothetical protein